MYDLYGVAEYSNVPYERKTKSEGWSIQGNGKNFSFPKTIILDWCTRRFSTFFLWYLSNVFIVFFRPWAPVVSRTKSPVVFHCFIHHRIPTDNFTVASVCVIMWNTIYILASFHWLTNILHFDLNLGKVFDLICCIHIPGKFLYELER